MLKNVMVGIGSAAASAIILVACGAFGNPTTNDLKNSPDVYPEYSSTILNVDRYPNISIICYQGAGFATTTRPDQGSLVLVPEWDAFCAKQIGKQATQGGQP